MKNALFTTLYRRAVDGLPVLGTPADVVARLPEGSSAARAERLERLYVGLCSGTGFACGLPGYATMPLTVPANIASVALLQLHMCAAIALLDGRDLQDAGTREVCIDCVLDNLDHAPRRDETEGVLERVGTKIAERGVRFVSEQVPRWLSRRGARSLPLVGGLVSGVADAYSTRRVGRAARQAFLGAEAE